MIPRKKSLVYQLASIIRDGIRDGLWSDWLPSERSLCEDYGVSRNTVRAAINRLETEGVVQALHGTGTRITGKPEHTDEPEREGVVGLITTRSIEQVRQTTAIWLDELRELLFEAGLRLHIHEGQHYFRGDPAKALKSLSRRHQHCCWLLQQSNLKMQEWFAEQAVPCVVAGSAYPDISLPSVDLDYRALCRHAVGLMIGRGHRSISLLTPGSKRAGDLEGEKGFLEGIAASSHRNLEGSIVRHGNDVGEISSAVESILTADARPSAILVGRSCAYLTLLSRMAQFGMRVPNDISVVCRDAEPFFQFLSPKPSHYYINPVAYAKKLINTILNVVDGAISRGSQTLILPDFAAGESLEHPSDIFAG